MTSLGKIQKTIVNYMKYHGGVNVLIEVSREKPNFFGYWYKDVIRSRQLLVDRGLIKEVGENRYSFP